MKPTAQTIATIEAARTLLELGVYVTPLRGKEPFLKEWPNLRLAEPDFQRHFVNGEGLGALLGIPPVFLVDADIDDALALRCVAEKMISGQPKTGWVFGRKSKPRSHFVYKSPGEFKPVQFEDDVTLEANKARGEKDSHMLLELRGTGVQTVFPPTLHEESGEQRYWEEKPTAANLKESNDAILRPWAARVAVAVLLARHYPLFAKGHKLAHAFSGWLGISGWSEEQVAEIVVAAAKLARDPDVAERRRNVESTFKRLNDGNAEVEQRKHLEELFGEKGKKICKKVAGWLSLKKERPVSGEDLYSDSANADLVLAKNAGSLLYCSDEHQWYYADEQRWKRDRTNTVYSRVEKVLRERFAEVAATKAQREIWEALGTLSHGAYASCLHVLQGRQEIQVLPEEFDADPMLLGVQNGILDLKTRCLRELTLELRVANCAPVVFAPTAKPEKFLEYLKRVQPDEEIQKLLQRISGISLAGYQVEACFIFFHGPGANGKSVFIYLIHSVLGTDYAFKANKQLIFMPDRGERAAAANDYVDLRGKRIITSNETAARNWNMIFIKEFTGGEPMHGRQLYQRAVNFKPVGKIIVSANEKPRFEKVQEAERRRFVYIPWSVIIPEEERISPVSRYAETLLAGEGKSGILNWALDGLAEVVANDWRLMIPESVRKATEDYLSESDRVKQFITTRVNDVPDAPSATVSTKTLRLHYLAYLGGHNPKYFINARKFTEECGRIFGSTRCERGRQNLTWVHGVSMKTEAVEELNAWQSEERQREPGEDDDELPF